MTNLKKRAIVSALTLALTLTGCTSVSAAEVAEPAVAICYLEDLQSSEYLDGLTAPALYRVEGGELLDGIAAMPEDVTAEYAGDTGFGVPENAERGYAFRIRVDKNLFWEDGKAVTAEDLKTTLLAGLEESRWIANADAYLADQERPAEEVISLQEAGFASASDARAAGFDRFYIDLSGFWGLDSGWKSVEDRRRVIDYAMTPGLDEMYVTPAYLYQNYLAEGMSLHYFQSAYLGVAARREALTTEDVGLLKTGEFELVVITAEAVTSQTVAARLAELKLTRSDFEGCYGPYRVADEGADEIRLERNPYWQGQAYPADVIRCLSR